jgi:hypothetical protein
MAASTTGKIAEVIFENAIETHEEQTQILGLVDSFTSASGNLQNSSNFTWRGVQQHRPVLSGWDLTGQEQGVIQETYPAILGTPTNDLVELRADDLRDSYFWAEAGKESGRKQGAILNKAVSDVITNTGSLAYRTNTTSGFNFIAQAQTIMDERQAMADQRKFILSPRDNLAFATELSGRQTVQGRPATVWESGQLAQNVAGFDVYTGSYLSTIAGGADPATTVTANVSLKPEAGSVSATGVVTNIDYRVGTILVASSASYNVGDIVTFANGGVTVKAVGLTDKTVTDQAMTFRIVAKPNGTSVQVYPKPIAVNDPALSALEQAYGNINTRILSTATMNRVNIDALARPSVFFDKKSIEVFHGEIPAQYFNQFGGQRVISETLKSGQKMYMLYDANSTTMNFKFRVFCWYGITNKNPSANGVAIRF